MGFDETCTSDNCPLPYFIIRAKGIGFPKRDCEHRQGILCILQIQTANTRKEIEKRYKKLKGNG